MVLELNSATLFSFNIKWGQSKKRRFSTQKIKQSETFTTGHQKFQNQKNSRLQVSAEDFKHW